MMPLTSMTPHAMIASLVFIFFIVTTARATLAKTGPNKDFPNSVELSDLLHTETVIIDNLRNYVNALDNKITAIKHKTQEIRSIYNVALSDRDKYFGNPINTFNLIKRMTYEWAAIRNLAWQDVTGHVIENITQFSEFLTFPSEEDLDEAVGKLLTIQDVYQMESSQVAAGEFNGIKFGSEMSWSDCLAIGQQSFRQGEHLVAKMWLQTALEKLPLDAGNPEKIKARIEILDTLASSAYQSGNFREALRLTEEILELNPKNKRAIAASATFREKIKKNISKSKSSKPRKTAEELLAQDVCRGTTEQYSSLSLQSICSYVDGSFSFLGIAPVKLEIISVDPFIAIYHNVFSDEEVEMLKDILKDTEGINILKKYAKRLERVTGHSAQNIGKWTSIRSNFYDEIDFKRISRKTKNKRSFGVLWIQLNEPRLGGAVAFPQLERSVSIPKGSMLYWSTQNEFKEVDYRTNELNCPVIAGTLEAVRAPVLVT